MDHCIRIKAGASSVFNGIKTNISNAWSTVKTNTTAAWSAIKSSVAQHGYGRLHVHLESGL